MAAEYAKLMEWAADGATSKKDIFVRMESSKNDAGAMLAIFDGVLMRDGDNIVKGICKMMGSVDREHLAVSVEHAALLGRIDHCATLLKELKIDAAFVADAVAYVTTKDAGQGQALQTLAKTPVSENGKGVAKK